MANAQAPLPLLLTPQAAPLLGIRAQTLRAWRVQGKGPSFVKLSFKKRGRIAYDVREIERWRQRNTRTSTCDPGPGAK